MITFNGQSYASPDEMPPDVRKMYEETLKIFGDKNGDGEPDLFKTPFLGNMLRDTFADMDADGIPDIMQEQFAAIDGQIVSGSPVIVYDGKTYNSFDDLPASAQEEMRQRMAQVVSTYPDLQQSDPPGGPSLAQASTPDVVHADDYPPVESDHLESRSLISLPLILFLTIGCLALLLFGVYYLMQR